MTNVVLNNLKDGYNKIIYNNNILRIIKTDNIWFCGKDIGSLLKYKDTRRALDHANEINKMTLSNLKKTFNLKNIKDRGNLIYVDLNGMHMILLKSNSCKVLDIAKDFNINIINNKIPSKEAQTINYILTSFSSERMITQYTVDKYRADLYFPEYNIWIECDEKNHINYNIDDEIERESYIKNKLNCIFIRYNPDDKQFNIFDIISKIYIYITDYKQIKINEKNKKELERKDIELEFLLRDTNSDISILRKNLLLMQHKYNLYKFTKGKCLYILNIDLSNTFKIGCTNKKYDVNLKLAYYPYAKLEYLIYGDSIHLLKNLILSNFKNKIDKNYIKNVNLNDIIEFIKNIINIKKLIFTESNVDPYNKDIINREKILDEYDDEYDVESDEEDDN